MFLPRSVFLFNLFYKDDHFALCPKGLVWHKAKAPSVFSLRDTGKTLVQGNGFKNGIRRV